MSMAIEPPPAVPEETPMIPGERPIDAEDEAQAAIRLVRALSGKLGTIGLDAHDAASHLSDVAKQFERQDKQLQRLRVSAEAMVEANKQIDRATETAHATAESLHDLGVPQADWPVITMLNTNTNQDACQGATLTLTYSGIEATG